MQPVGDRGLVRNFSLQLVTLPGARRQISTNNVLRKSHLFVFSASGHLILSYSANKCKIKGNSPWYLVKVKLFSNYICVFGRVPSPTPLTSQSHVFLRYKRAGVVFVCPCNTTQVARWIPRFSRPIFCGHSRISLKYPVSAHLIYNFHPVGAGGRSII